MQRIKRRSTTIMIGAFLCLAPLVGHATMVLSLNLEQMAALADTIFLGKVIEVNAEQDSEGRSYLEISFDVVEVYKGDTSSPLIIKQAHSSLTGGLPVFHPGEEVVVFLHGENSLGFTSPVGFGQGVYRVHVDVKGQKRAINDIGNEGILKGMSFGLPLKTQGMTEGQFGDLTQNPKSLHLDHLRLLLQSLLNTSQES